MKIPNSYRPWRRLLNATFLIVSIATVGCSSTVNDPIGLPAEGGETERGRSLVKGLAACGACHGERKAPEALLSGGLPVFDKYGEVRAPNITPARSGLGEWTPRHVITVLRGGPNKDDKPLSRESHKGYEWMSDSDLLAIVSYLRTLPPIENEVPRRKIGFIKRNTVGFFDVQREVKGHVPEIDKTKPTAYGKYLADHVARCSSCHNSPSGFLTGEGYLDGGKAILTAKGQKVAPNITNSDVYGIGAWSREDLIHYLRTGVTPDGSRTDPDYCPTRFYRNADENDLVALAAYLKAGD